MMGLKYHEKYVFITQQAGKPPFRRSFLQAFCKVLRSQKRPSGPTILAKKSMPNTLSKSRIDLFGL